MWVVEITVWWTVSPLLRGNTIGAGVISAKVYFSAETREASARREARMTAQGAETIACLTTCLLRQINITGAGVINARVCISAGTRHKDNVPPEVHMTTRGVETIACYRSKSL
jgi:hypothetical protein